MGVAVRIAHLADAPALNGLAVATFGLACPPGTRQDDIDAFVEANLSVEAFRGYLLDENRELLIVDSDDDPVGYTMLVYSEPADADVRACVTARPTVELSKVYVLPGQHGSGAAAVLLAATMDTARQRGARSMWLGVNQHNDRANRFYEKNGFVRVGVKRFRVGEELFDDYVRECVLSVEPARTPSR